MYRLIHVFDVRCLVNIIAGRPSCPKETLSWEATEDRNSLQMLKCMDMCLTFPDSICVFCALSAAVKVAAPCRNDHSESSGEAIQSIRLEPDRLSEIWCRPAACVPACLLFLIKTIWLIRLYKLGFAFERPFTHRCRRLLI
jgi:hypothetical protein